MPVAVIGPAGASLAESRQLSGLKSRNLSWLKFASICKSVPRSPAFASRNTSCIGGSKRFSCPTASATSFSLHAWIARSTSARESESGFSQNTCLRAFAAAMICSVCCVQRTTACTIGSLSAARKEASCAIPCVAANSAAAGAGSMLFTTFSFGLSLRSGTMVRPHQPSPISATRSWSSPAMQKLLRGRACLARGAHPALGFLFHEFRELARRACHHIDAAIGEALDDIRCFHGVDDHAVELVDHRLRRAGRDEDALPGAARELRITGLRHGRRIRERGEALGARHGDEAQAAALYVIHRGRSRHEHHVRLAAGKSGDGRTGATLIGHVHHVEVLELAEHLGFEAVLASGAR